MDVPFVNQTLSNINLSDCNCQVRINTDILEL